MEHWRRLAGLWSWLPAFRAVAETQHLPTASRALHVGASAISRTLGLLEDEVGQPLFDRVGRRLVLNPAGETLLQSVRDAMRLLDEGLARIGEGQLVGPVRVSVPEAYAADVALPALNDAAREHPGLVPHICDHPGPGVEAMLLRGELDLALLEQPEPSDELHVEPLMRIGRGLYCARSHPLARRRRPKRSEVLAHPVAAPAPAARARLPDRWPAHVPRRVALYAERMGPLLAACAGGGCIALLPDTVGRRAQLHRLPLELVEPSTLYLVHRPTLVSGGRTEAVAEALRALAARMVRTRG